MNHRVHLLRTLYIMADVVEARDPYTGGHLWRVSQFSGLLAEAGGLSVTDVARIKLGGYLHDLGKVGVPDAILNKPGRLSDEEFDVIRTHPAVGHRILSGHPFAGLVGASILSHHETILGKGYPQGLAGDAIPLEARIVGICDAFDAMTSTRSYRRGMPADKALGIIESELGRQFDAQWGARFITLGREGKLDAIVQHSDVGIPLHECPGCGPTVVRRRDQGAGDSVYCRVCASHAVVESSGDQPGIHFSGRKASAAELEAKPDLALIEELTTEAVEKLGAEGL